ncbi:fimbrial protein [Scandinavium sp.]|uniref:fimbrial protein n=1 Tax=Scandinavium sp. TaxID=2830653 RepID=UPI002899B275|nr:fimbrial protein [Scandinavium sp.]
MNTPALWTAVALLAVSATAQTMAANPTGQFTITTTILSRTCTFDNETQTVALENVETREFSDQSMKKPQTFDVNIHCDNGVSSVKIVPSGPADDTGDATAFKNQGDAANVALRLQNAEGNVLTPDGNSSVTVTPEDGVGAYRFRVGYVATQPGKVSAGGFSAAVTLRFAYD